ncbi:hypothetical protein ACH4FA_36910 [Streptomyces sp. NPDC017966]|uniref:Uncharacterized protein n=1 Tax=Streptomyces griseoincarnatus TaxID=29305 RepID=A0ABT0W403_STRGI|nr:hypothetical protein [Streptomyces griseoincarnatus]MCM2518308.1 hypothetical protein [Streptomyces griseoincarnatus]
MPENEFTAHMIESLEDEIVQARESGAVPPRLCDALAAVIGLYEEATKRARIDDSFLQAWALNYQIENFTKPTESGARRLLPGLEAALYQLNQAFSEDEERA